MKKFLALSLLTSNLIFAQYVSKQELEEQARRKTEIEALRPQVEAYKKKQEEWREKDENRFAVFFNCDASKHQLKFPRFHNESERHSYCSRIRQVLMCVFPDKNSPRNLVIGDQRLCDGELLLLTAALEAKAITAAEITPQRWFPELLYAESYPAAIIAYNNVKLADAYLKTCELGLERATIRAAIRSSGSNTPAMLEAFMRTLNYEARRTIEHDDLPFTTLAESDKYMEYLFAVKQNKTSELSSFEEHCFAAKQITIPKSPAELLEIGSKIVFLDDYKRTDDAEKAEFHKRAFERSCQESDRWRAEVARKFPHLVPQQPAQQTSDALKEDVKN